MTKRFIFQTLIGILLLMLNVAIDCSRLGKMYAEVKACELNINHLLKHKSLAGLKDLLSQDELNDLEKIKADYCRSLLKTIK